MNRCLIWSCVWEQYFKTTRILQFRNSNKRIWHKKMFKELLALLLTLFFCLHGRERICEELVKEREYLIPLYVDRISGPSY
jgi:hypothetical protein